MTKTPIALHSSFQAPKKANRSIFKQRYAGIFSPALWPPKHQSGFIPPSKHQKRQIDQFSSQDMQENGQPQVTKQIAHHEFAPLPFRFHFTSLTSPPHCLIGKKGRVTYCYWEMERQVPHGLYFPPRNRKRKEGSQLASNLKQEIFSWEYQTPRGKLLSTVRGHSKCSMGSRLQVHLRVK